MKMINTPQSSADDDGSFSFSFCFPHQLFSFQHYLFSNLRNNLSTFTFLFFFRNPRKKLQKKTQPHKTKKTSGFCYSKLISDQQFSSSSFFFFFFLSVSQSFLSTVALLPTKQVLLSSQWNIQIHCSIQTSKANARITLWDRKQQKQKKQNSKELYKQYPPHSYHFMEVMLNFSALHIFTKKGARLTMYSNMMGLSEVEVGKDYNYNNRCIIIILQNSDVIF